MEKISIEASLTSNRCLIDVRSPSEFACGHIPCALNLPLFSDEERKIVGITYKKIGKREAIEKGLELVSFNRILQEIRKQNLPSSITVYCARGGMRSASMGWLLNLLGYEVFVIDGGYKSYRRWRMKQLSQSYALLVLGGETGSGKTKILKALADLGENVIDLEGLANHRGSVFGEQGFQPTQEQFENELAMAFFKQKNKMIWIEDESRKIGSLTIPRPIYEQMRNTRLLKLQIPIETRIKECLREYLPLGLEKLAISIHRLHKRMGGLAAKKALEDLEQNNIQACCGILLQYYDKKYRYGSSLRNPQTIELLPVNEESFEEIVNQVKIRGINILQNTL